MACHAYADSHWPDGFPWHRQRNWGDEHMGWDGDRVLQNVQGNLSHLRHKIPMVQVEDFPEAMQRQVVGVPHAWVWLFWCLENVILYYHDMHPTPLAYMPWSYIYRPYMYFEGVSPILYYDIIFFEKMKYKNIGPWIYLYMLQCVHAWMCFLYLVMWQMPI